jgi:CelD/BcsL family acetyltransferase involved in cellulose biosynthesis
MINVSRESFDSLAALRDTEKGLQWNSPFVLPMWMQTWWQHFHSENELLLLSIHEDGRVIGIAPFQVKNHTASLVGGDNVCDYLDFIVMPGQEKVFFSAVLEAIHENQVNKLDLGLLRPDSVALTQLAGFARERGLAVSVLPEDVSSEMELPATFEEYLGLLNTKQRHEVRRKLRRLNEAGKVEYHFLTGDTDLAGTIDNFMHLFSLARDEKARFMTAEMDIFFRALSRAAAAAGILRFGAVSIDSHPTAMVMCFDYNNILYLYNSGFDPQYDSVSVGLMSKVLTIQESIQQGKKRFEFLKGNEIYKERLGGKEIPLSRCKIDIP